MRGRRKERREMILGFYGALGKTHLFQFPAHEGVTVLFLLKLLWIGYLPHSNTPCSLIATLEYSKGRKQMSLF